MRPTLVILAAGMGSRYGGLKQLDVVGPAEETVMDYSVFDAVRAGLGRVLFIIRRDFEAEFKARIGAKYRGCVEVDYAFQSVAELPAGHAPAPDRQKPWGTGHAVWCARHALGGPFAVINADDFYGRESFARLAHFLAQPPGASRPQFALVGFRLGQTLSEHGAVSRGICQVSAEGRLVSVTEHTGIAPAAVGPGRAYASDATVSMNCWAFTPALFPELERQLTAFLARHATDPKAEFYLPAAVSALVASGAADVHVLPTAAKWFGVTYREDKPRVAAALRDLVARGEYPPALHLSRAG